MGEAGKKWVRGLIYTLDPGRLVGVGETRIKRGRVGLWLVEE